MNWFRIALAIVYCTAPIFASNGAAPRVQVAVAAQGNPVTEVHAPSSTGLGLSALLDGPLTAVAGGGQRDGVRLGNAALTSDLPLLAGITSSSPYTVQSVPCTLIPFSDRLPYQATAPPLVL